MNPAKRKKLARIKMAEEKLLETKVVAKPEQIKNGLKELSSPVLVSEPESVPQQDQVLVPEEVIIPVAPLFTEPESVPQQDSVIIPESKNEMSEDKPADLPLAQSESRKKKKV